MIQSKAEERYDNFFPIAIIFSIIMVWVAFSQLAINIKIAFNPVEYEWAEKGYLWALWLVSIAPTYCICAVSELNISIIPTSCVMLLTTSILRAALGGIDFVLAIYIMLLIISVINTVIMLKYHYKIYVSEKCNNGKRGKLKDFIEYHCDETKHFRWSLIVYLFFIGLFLIILIFV